MTTNTGKPYERLTVRVFKALLAQQSVKNVRVEHDIKLTGLSRVPRQVDVYWEFEAAGITHRVIVECKDHGDPVNVGTVSELVGRLYDMPGHLGAIVARSGFQSGARELAEAHRIVLYELRPPEEEDWKPWDGFITGVDMEMKLDAPRMHAVDFVLDEAWNRQQMRDCGLDRFEYSLVVGPELTIEDEGGVAIATVQDIYRGMIGSLSPGPPEWREHHFADPVYIQTGRAEFPRLRALGVKMLLEMRQLRIPIQVRLDAFVSLVLKEVGNGNVTLLDAHGQPLAPPPTD